jgi:hypothetical protein
VADNKTGIDSSKKYGAAMANAGVGSHAAETTLMTKDEAEWLTVMPEAEFRATLEKGEYEFAPRNFALKENQTIYGYLEGNGPDAEFERKDGTINIVKTWIFRHLTKGIRLSILSSVQLDKMLPPFIGSNVNVRRGEQQNIGDGKRMTNFEVWGDWIKDKEGNRKPRTWAMTSRVVDVHALEAGSQRSLSSGNMEDAS